MQGRPGDESIVVYHSRLKMTLVAGGALLFVLSAGPLVYTGMQTGGAGLVISSLVAALNTGFFGACLLYALRRMSSRAPALMINARGIYDDSSALSAGFVAWNAIDSVFEAEVQFQRFLCIKPKDVEGFLQSQPAWKRQMMRANIGLIGAPIAISTVALPLSLSELERLIAAHLSYDVI